MAVVVLVLLLLLKFSALLVLLQAQQPGALGPGAPARAHGAAGAVSLHPLCASEWPRPGTGGEPAAQRALVVLALVVIGCLLLGAIGLLALTLAAVTFLLARRAMLRRLGGTTGDTAGALLELVECAVLVGLALQVGR